MTKPRHDSETPAIGHQVIVACAFIHHQFDGVHKVFLPQRSPSKKFFPGVYEVPGGHIDFGEDIKAGLQREVREEINKDIEIGDPFYVFTYLNEVKGAHSIEVVYFATFVPDIEQITLNPDDHTGYSWFSEDQFEEYSVNRKPDDVELQAIRRGFALLQGAKLSF